jgi:Protein of unknown function (DUF2795)
VDTARLAELQTVLEGVPLPAAREELIDYALRQGVRPELLWLLEALPERAYDSIDEVAETLAPVQPQPAAEQTRLPRPESGVPPGGEAYTDASAEPGSVRPRGPE